MGTTNNGIIHLAYRPFPAPAYCGSKRAIMAVRTLEEFIAESNAAGGKVCKRCKAKLTLGIIERLP